MNTRHNYYAFTFQTQNSNHDWKSNINQVEEENMMWVERSHVSCPHNTRVAKTITDMP